MKGNVISKPRSKKGCKNLISDKLVQLRKEQKLSQRDLAQKLQLAGYDMDKNVITRIETNKRYVTDMRYTFNVGGMRATNVYIGDLSTWNVSKVTTFNSMFYCCGMNVRSWNFGNLGNWNVSSSTDFFCMFCNAGYESKSFYVGNLEKWNTAKATTMGNMFENAGLNTTWSLNCSKWNVAKVSYHPNFNAGVESKVKAPKWVQ